MAKCMMIVEAFGHTHRGATIEKSAELAAEGIGEGWNKVGHNEGQVGHGAGRNSLTRHGAKCHETGGQRGGPAKLEDEPGSTCEQPRS